MLVINRTSFFYLRKYFGLSNWGVLLEVCILAQNGYFLTVQFARYEKRGRRLDLNFKFSSYSLLLRGLASIHKHVVFINNEVLCLYLQLSQCSYNKSTWVKVSLFSWITLYSQALF